MRRRLLANLAVIGCAALMMTVQAESSQKTPRNQFGPAKVWTVHLEIPAKEYEAMQPAPPRFPGAGGPPVPKATPGKRKTARNLFGTEFPWAKGAFTANGKSHRKVSVRYDGDITYLVSARVLKRPLKVRFDSGKLYGLGSIELHAMPLDPSQAREALAFSVFRSAGVAVPQTAFAEVTLSVPGKYDKTYLGLYTVVAGPGSVPGVDVDKGLLMQPFRVPSVDFLGDNWTPCQSRYRPTRTPTAKEAKRVIDFARLVNQATDAEFRKRIDSFLDVDAVLRFLAANALTSNLHSVFAVGHNYALYLDAKTGKFAFIPGTLEFSLANYQLLGTPQQLMNLSLTRPYPGQNKLVDRLLAIKDVNAKYRKLLKDLSATVFTKEKLLVNIQAIQKATEHIQKKETKAAAARRESTRGPQFGPQPPDLKTFALNRTASVAAQLAGTSTGYVPRPFAFGPAAGGPGKLPGGFGRPAGNAKPIDAKEFRESVQVPAEFTATLFAVPPKVNYPVAITSAPTGEIYVAVDEQGSLGRTMGGGRILRCVDRDGDGKVDDVSVFARVEHPRGVCFRNGSLWVMHPPTLSVFRDENGDGKAERHQVLVTGLTTDMIINRGGDHTTNCVRMGIDGWLYIGVGDYGIKQAKGTDGRTITLRGGGIVRVRPDGTELEIYCTGLRNPFDVAIDPFLNLFTRDNTNDGGGWDTRVSHLMQTAEYGYPRLFANFTEEIMPTLGTFGGGGGTGGLFLQDPRWPETYRNTLLTGDWGRSEVYRHALKPHGPTFDLKQDVFLKLPRATGMDIDVNGRLYVASWRGGEASVNVGPNVGFIARVTPKGHKPAPFPDLTKAKRHELIRLLAAPQSVVRLHVQGEILRRGRNAGMTKALVALASDKNALTEGRVAAIFTLKQLDGMHSQVALLKLLGDVSVREFALRALTDRRTELHGLDPQRFIAALKDESPRVRAQALISLGRLNMSAAAKHILRLTNRPRGSAMPTRRPIQNQPDPDRVIPHLAVRALVSLKAVDACLEALDGPHRQGALWALRSMHDPKAVDGLITKLRTARSTELRRGILATLIRLYHREANYNGSWWGIRPDSTGPYYDRVPWKMSRRIGSVVTAAVLDGDRNTATYLKTELARHRVSLTGIPGGFVTVKKAQEKPIVVPKADPKNPDQIGNVDYAFVLKRVLSTKGNVQQGRALFKSQSCTACHTTADGQTPKGPHLVDIGKRYKPHELVESILKPNAKLAQGYETYLFAMKSGQVFTGFVVGDRADAVVIREANGVQRELKRTDIELRRRQKLSAMPDGLVANLTPRQLSDLIAYLRSLH